MDSEQTDIETCDTQNEGEEEIRDEFLYFHDAENIGLLLVAVRIMNRSFVMPAIFFCTEPMFEPGFSFISSMAELSCVIIEQTAGKVE